MMATVKERAERIIDFWLNDKSLDFKIRSNIEHEIVAAIEEEREQTARLAALLSNHGERGEELKHHILAARAAATKGS